MFPPNIPEKLVVAVVSATMLGVVGWVYSTGNRVTALETRQPVIEKKLDNIAEDVRQIRDWIVPAPRPGKR
jgi:hypothetical protein